MAPKVAPWIHDAAAFLEEVFIKSPFCDKVVEGFKSFEAALGYPSSKVSRISTNLIYIPIG